MKEEWVVRSYFFEGRPDGMMRQRTLTEVKLGVEITIPYIVYLTCRLGQQPWQERLSSKQYGVKGFKREDDIRPTSRL